MKRILIIYYSQTQQTKEAIGLFKEKLEPLAEIDEVSISAIRPYAFPWNPREFFRIFPDCVNEIGTGINEIQIPQKKYDLIVLGFQVWFLSPSLPIQGFLKSEWGRIIKDTRVIGIVTCRNMWVEGAIRLRKFVDFNKGKYLGQFVLMDRSPTWASLVTTPRWLFTGKKGRFLFFPRPGIQKEEYQNFSQSLDRVREIINDKNWDVLLPTYLHSFADSITSSYVIVLEMVGRKFFQIWAGLISALSTRGTLWNDFLITLFRINLILLIILLLPSISLLNFLIPGLIKKLAETSLTKLK